MRFCPFAQRPRLVLLAKGIKHEEVNINLKSKPDWFFEKSPLGLVPTLETSDGKIIYESPIVCDYLDEAFPGVKLTPSDPYEKAQQKMVQELFSGIFPVFRDIIYGKKSNEEINKLKVQFFEKLKKMEEVLDKKNTAYFGGESVSMVDYMLWPWFERFCFADLNEYLEKTPHIKAWQDRMMQDPAVKETYTKPSLLKEFFKLYSQDNLDAVDLGLE
ncbi:glutathione S-transferase omega-1-like isoform X2 [Hyperolius riggenbachi]